MGVPTYAAVCERQLSEQSDCVNTGLTGTVQIVAYFRAVG